MFFLQSKRVATEITSSVVETGMTGCGTTGVFGNVFWIRLTNSFTQHNHRAGGHSQPGLIESNYIKRNVNHGLS